MLSSKWKTESGIGDGTITGGLNAVNEKNQQLLSKSMKITTTAQGISAIEISNPDVVVSAICTDTEAHIVLPFRVGNSSSIIKEQAMPEVVS